MEGVTVAELSPALMTDLVYALSRYGIEVQDVPRDHEGLSIVDRAQRLIEDGSAHSGCDFRLTDLRREDASVWDLSPENPDTVEEQERLMDDVHDLLSREGRMRGADALSIVLNGELPRPEHMSFLVALRAYLDGGDEPGFEPAIWSDTELVESVLESVPPLREAQRQSELRGKLVHELATGAVPPAAEQVTRMTLDSEAFGLRNADITLAAHEVAVANLRDALQATIDALTPHLDLADRLRAANADLDAVEQALRWPGDWRSAPKRLTGSHVTE